MSHDPVFFAALAAFAVAIYVLADGFDLGIGIIFLAAPREADRDTMMQSLEPTWDGNETWLVMGGTLLFAAFPAAYYVLLPAFYLPVILMLLGLVMRGVAFAFRVQARRFQFLWNIAFAGGSCLAVFCQGLILGGIVDGVPVRDGMFAGGAFEFVSLLGLLCGIGLVGGYALLGAAWVVWRTDGATQVFGREIGHAALVLTALMMALVSAWTALSQPEVAARWFSWPNIGYLVPVPILTALVIAATWWSLWSRREALPFLLAVALFLLGFIGLVISLWPYVVPRAITVWDGASDAASLRFIAPGLIVIMPIVLTYQAYAYWVFRGKTVVHAAR